MAAIEEKSKTDSVLIRRLVFEAAWIACQQCCFWSSVATQGGEIRNRGKK
jgi:hypothetical protein